MKVIICQYHYAYESCERPLNPEAGDSRVFCSFGKVNHPPMQNRE